MFLTSATPFRTQRKTIENLNQIEVLNRALSDMPVVSS